MEGIQGADTEGRAVTTGQIDAGLPGAARKVDTPPETSATVILELLPKTKRPCFRDS